MLRNIRRGAWVLIVALVLAIPPIAHAVAAPSVETADYMHARYYSPNLGRFMSVDPIGGDIGSSQSWNRYSYVENNPVLKTDPDGRFSHIMDAAQGTPLPTAQYHVNHPIRPAELGELALALTPAGGPSKGLKAASSARKTISFKTIGAKIRGFLGGMKAKKASTARKTTHKKLLRPDQSALGPHSTFKTNQDGKVTGHAEWTPNSQNPTGFDEVKRVDTQHAQPHSDFDKKTGEIVDTPHTHTKTSVQPAKNTELPKND